MPNVENEFLIDSREEENKEIEGVLERVGRELEDLEGEVEEVKNPEKEEKKDLENDGKNQKELERIYNLKDEAKWFVAGRKEPMSYRDITMYLKNKNDSDEKRYPEFYEALLHAKNELENNYPGIERNVIMYIDVLGQKKYKEEKVEEEKNPEEKKNVEEEKM